MYTMSVYHKVKITMTNITYQYDETKSCGKREIKKLQH